MKHYNDIRERRRREMAQQYVDYQCDCLYYQLCGECHLIELSEKEKSDMIRRAKKPIRFGYKTYKKNYKGRRKYD